MSNNKVMPNRLQELGITYDPTTNRYITKEGYQYGQMPNGKLTGWYDPQGKFLGAETYTNRNGANIPKIPGMGGTGFDYSKDKATFNALPKEFQSSIQALADATEYQHGNFLTHSVLPAAALFAGGAALGGLGGAGAAAGGGGGLTTYPLASAPAGSALGGSGVAGGGFLGGSGAAATGGGAGSFGGLFGGSGGLSTAAGAAPGASLPSVVGGGINGSVGGAAMPVFNGPVMGGTGSSFLGKTGDFLGGLFGGHGSGGGGFDWSSLGNLLGAVGGGVLGHNTATHASDALWNRGQYNPFNINTPFGGASFANGTATGSLSPGSQSQYDALGGLANSALTGLQGPYGAVSPELLNQFRQYQQGLAIPNMGGASAGQGFLGLGQGWDNTYNQSLDLLRQSSAFGEGQQRQNNIADQYGRGILASTAGEYQTRGLEGALGQADVQRQLGSFGMAQNLTQQQNQSVTDRFQRAMDLFGLGQNTGQNNAQLGLGGQQQFNSFLANLFGLGGNLGGQQSAANIGASGGLANVANTDLGFINGFLQNLGYPS